MRPNVVFAAGPPDESVGLVAAADSLKDGITAVEDGFDNQSGDADASRVPPKFDVFEPRALSSAAASSRNSSAGDRFAASAADDLLCASCNA